MHQGSASEGGDARGKSGHGVMMIAAVPVLYVVLLGPAAMVHRICTKPMQHAIEAVYAPLEWADEHIPGRPLKRYVRIWCPYP